MEHPGRVTVVAHSAEAFYAAPGQCFRVVHNVVVVLTRFRAHVDGDTLMT